jgi:predicted nucleotidyltransferase component of viral defense system
MAYTETELRAVQEHFGFLRPAPIEKDWHVIRALAAITAIDSAPFALIFAGGTALARAHKLIRRMSEDVDFKIVSASEVQPSRAGLRNQLGDLRNRVTQALQAAGFAFDPADKAAIRSRNENRYTVYQLPYAESGPGEGLRPTIQIELTYATLRLPLLVLPVYSFVSEAFGRPPDVAAVPCVSVTETAAEKLVSLTRRTAMDIAGLSRDADPALVRHIYDLHMMRDLIDPGRMTTLARAISEADAEEFRNQYPAYAADIAGETRKAIDALRTNPLYRARYASFVAAMVYGERTAFDAAMTTVTAAVQPWIGS